ncbi:hypothetical protein [Actinoplanes sp. NPDC048796]|uniref:hypothetical protein n=1 Tax=unclassified Actinoplanes TaxID=2626549 RepID=UPI0033D7AE4E
MSPYLKAVFAAVAGGLIAFLAALLSALQGENTGFDTITDGQWVTAVLALFIGAAGTGTVTYQVQNRRSGTDSGKPGPDDRP